MQFVLDIALLTAAFAFANALLFEFRVPRVWASPPERVGPV